MSHNDPTMPYSDSMYNEALIAIEDLCIIIANLSLHHFGLNSPNRAASDVVATEVNRELQYNITAMEDIVARNVPLQTLPVIPRSTYADEINACLKLSPLWHSFQKLQLSKNMRVEILQDSSAMTFSDQ
uniref:ATP-dependent DNA helicase n=1 Tax=Anopheles arabiensis TaxID=7173 RepID=A0A182HPH9_ANOAR